MADQAGVTFVLPKWQVLLERRTGPSPGKAGPSAGNGADPCLGASWVVSQSRMLAPNHGRDSTGAQGRAPFENRSAGAPIPAALPSNQRGALCEEGDQFRQEIAREQSFVTERKLTNLFFCENCIGLFS